MKPLVDGFSTKRTVFTKGFACLSHSVQDAVDHLAAIPRGPLTALLRVYATPEAVADVADALVSRRFRSYDREWRGEWDGAHLVRTAIDVFREPVG